jgi:hypothetical protein
MRYDYVLMAFPLIVATVLPPLIPSALSAPIIFLADADTTVRRDFDIRENDNYGLDPRLIVGGNRFATGIPFGGADGMRSLIRFDLSAISGPIRDATLTLTVNLPRGEAVRLDVHRILDSGPLTPWIEGNGDESGTTPGAVDTDSSFGVAWSGEGDNPAADAQNNQTQPNFDPAPVATVLLDVSLIQPGSTVTWDITSLVNDWVSGTVPNFGITLRDSLSTEGTWSFVDFGSREGEQFSQGAIVGPRLVLFTVPEPGNLALLGLVLVVFGFARRHKLH